MPGYSTKMRPYVGETSTAGRGCSATMASPGRYPSTGCAAPP